MKVQPVFKGKIHVTAVKDEQWTWYDYKTSEEDDKKILNAVKDIYPKYYTLDRQAISQKDGEQIREIIENAIGEKLDIPNDPVYSATYSKFYSVPKNKDGYSLLLFASEKFGSRGKIVGDRTAVDILI